VGKEASSSHIKLDQAPNDLMTLTNDPTLSYLKEMKVVLSRYPVHDLGVIEQCNPAVGEAPHLTSGYTRSDPTGTVCYYHSDNTAGSGRVGSSN
jgi:hypothetical protein